MTTPHIDSPQARHQTILKSITTLYVVHLLDVDVVGLHRYTHTEWTSLP